MSNEDKISTHYIDEDQESHSNQKEVSFGETLEFQVPIDKSKWSCWAKRWLKWPLLILFLSICLFFVYFRTLNAMENYISNIEQIQKQLNRQLGSKLFEEIDILENNLDMSIRNNSKQKHEIKAQLNKNWKVAIKNTRLLTNEMRLNVDRWKVNLNNTRREWIKQWRDIMHEMELNQKRMNITMKDVKLNIQDQRHELDSYHENVTNQWKLSLNNTQREWTNQLQNIKHKIELNKKLVNITMSDVKLNIQDQRNELDAYHENVSFSIGRLRKHLNALPDQHYLLGNVTRLENEVDDLRKGIDIYDNYIIFQVFKFEKYLRIFLES